MVETLPELLFSLPASNGKLERVFSILGTIKVEKRSLLTNESLDYLLLMNSGKTPFDMFDPNTAIDLWWSARQEDINKRPGSNTKHTAVTVRLLHKLQILMRLKVRQ